MDSVRWQSRQFVHLPAGPVDLDISLLPFGQAEVDTQVVLRDVAAATANFIQLLALAGYAVHARADGRAVGFGADAFDLDPIVPGSAIAAQQLRHVIDAVDRHIEV